MAHENVNGFKGVVHPKITFLIILMSFPTATTFFLPQNIKGVFLKSILAVLLHIRKVNGDWETSN